MQRAKTTGLRVKDNTKRKAQLMIPGIVQQWELEANLAATEQRRRYEGSFADYIQMFLSRKETECRENTVSAYKDYANKLIIPALGAKKITDLRLSDLQQFYDDLAKTHGANSLRRFHVVVNGALLEAVRDGAITDNFAKYVAFPKAKKYRGETYDESQLVQLREAAEKKGEPICSIIILATYALRREEICGLRWSDINLDAGTMEINNTVVQRGSMIIEAERTKTEKSNRKLFVRDEDIPYFERLMQTQIEAGIPLDKVCRMENGGGVKPDYVSHSVSKLMADCGLPHIRLHDLRGTAASILAKQASLSQVQEFLGHEDARTTANIYIQAQDDGRKKTAEMMSAALKKSAVCSEKRSETVLEGAPTEKEKVRNP